MIKNIDFDLVGSLITNLRISSNLTQEEFAKEIGVSKGAICQWEKGSGIKTENLYDIARYFDITVSELINGQLNKETDEDYFLRNYDLNSFDNFEEVDEENYNDLLEYLACCKNVIKRTMLLYKLCKEETLTKKQEKEYRRLFSYFEFDMKYVNQMNLFPFIDSFEHVFRELDSSYEIKEDSQIDYMLYKVFHLKIRINPMSLLNYESGDFAVNEYLELIGKERCNELLTNLIQDKSVGEIEESLAIRRLIQFGARCLFNNKGLYSFTHNEIEEEVFEQLDGIKVKNEIIKDRYNFFRNEEMYNYHDYNYNPYSWKNYDKDEYEYLIDTDTTNIVRDIVLLRRNDPKSYYNNLKNRDIEKLNPGRKHLN